VFGERPFMRHHALPRPLVALSLLFAINSFVCWIIAGLASISAAACAPEFA
jgi:hypothetical protein